MKMDGHDGDPFASVAKLCHTSSSQEVLFQNCPFARQSEVFSDNDSDSPEDEEATPVESTGIVMVSLPETPNDDNTPHDEFQTPPEDSLLFSSEEQRIATVDQDNHGFHDGDNHDDVNMAVDEGCTNGERTVDLGKDSDLGFSGMKSIERIKGFSARGSPSEKVSVEFPSKRLKLCEENSGVETCNCTSKSCEGCTDHERTVDLGKDSDLGFSGMNSIEKIKGFSARGSPSEKVSGEFPSRRLKLCEENLGVETCNYTSNSCENCDGTEEILVETKHIISCNGSTEVVESKCEENDGVLGFGEETAREDSAVRQGGESAGNGVSNGNISEGHELRSNSEGSSLRKNMDDFERFRYVGPSLINSLNLHEMARKSIRGPVSTSGGGRAENEERERKGKSIRGRRELPWSIRGRGPVSNSGRGRAENEERQRELVVGVSSPANPLWRSLMDVLQMLAERCESDTSFEDADMLEIAKSRGMTFPRPTWWPPEGYEEK
ncbi:hypothetical protein L1049_022200 [Liquidambar formosana]|uniref:Uncharacterized protein n=1 Tax=Liquidambar formosana TaxID=63359 RepID=A0AAP0WNU8_LIQFO